MCIKAKETHSYPLSFLYNTWFFSNLHCQLKDEIDFFKSQNIIIQCIFEKYNFVVDSSHSVNNTNWAIKVLHVLHQTIMSSTESQKIDHQNHLGLLGISHLEPSPSIAIINGLYSLFQLRTLWISLSLFLLRLEKDSHSSQHKWCFVSPSPISE